MTMFLSVALKRNREIISPLEKVASSLALSRRRYFSLKNPSKLNLLKDDSIPSLKDFMKMNASPNPSVDENSMKDDFVEEFIVDIHDTRRSNQSTSFHLETYGCQMNENDSEIVRAIMLNAGFREDLDSNSADVVFVNTCSIRENAENKVLQRIHALKNMKQKLHQQKIIGVLGCMAERMKSTLLEAKHGVDIVCGPDAYKDLPRLIRTVASGEESHGINVQLSLDETYGDVAPVRRSEHKSHAFISIMRGCNNMCAFCVVPFTRGRERSRQVESILREVEQLHEEGYKEVTLLGQNVNSYLDSSTSSGDRYKESHYVTADGFSNMYKLRNAQGVRFTELLDLVSSKAPNIRFRFTSPHPKDFPDDLLHLMAERSNISKQIHIPAQSGSTSVLQRMRRGYTRESYLRLVERIRAIVPGVALSSDFITGFCGETREEHLDTVSLMEQVKFEQAYMFAYSLRQKTHAAYHYNDDVPQEVKMERLHEIIDVFRKNATGRFQKLVGSNQAMLVESWSRHSTDSSPILSGRIDNNMRVFLPLGTSVNAPAFGSIVQVKIESSGPTSLSAALL
jgi:tRNA-N(6)-(isopentenyl)adenosine-37 thiotransferase enzyme MiaB